MAACEPEAAPLDTPEQLLSWVPGDEDELCVASVRLPPGEPARAPHQPRLLACHDMAGGYHGDRFVQGHTLAPGTFTADPYFLTHWRCLDAFCYFSHCLVTIPPPGWINAAHTHCVPVLGTFITEWEAGAAHCRSLFGCAAVAEAAAAALAAIAAHRGFEGWVINIENAVEQQHLPHLLHFLRVLTAKMREASPHSKIIWYDAVTIQGRLAWQNTLNWRNRPFFDACDAIWINYTWRRGTPAAVRREAGERAVDVYMGVDCFGRGTFGGGGFACDVALRACLDQGLSAALFATGWPYEGDAGPGAPASWRLRDALFWDCIEHAWLVGSGSVGGSQENWLLRLLRWFWRLLFCRWPCRPPAPLAMPAAAAAAAAPAPAAEAAPAVRQLPLYSNFSTGRGGAMYQRGRRLSPCPWFNLSLQTLQPLLRVHVDGSGGSGGTGGDSGSTSSSSSTVEASLTEAVAFSRGSSVQLGGHLQPGQVAVVELVPTAALLPPTGAWVRLAATHSPGIDVRLALRLAAAGSGSAAAHTSSIEIPLLRPGAPAAAPTATSAAWSSSVAVVATGAKCNHAAAGSGSRAAAGSVAATSWATWECQLGPDLFAEAAAAASSSGGGGDGPLMLIGVDLLLRGGGTADSEGASSLELRLGEFCIEAVHPSGPPLPPGKVQQLRCSGSQLITAAVPDSASSTLLAARLAWRPPPDGVHCCHVWCKFEGSNGQQLEPPAWLGVACANGYWVTGLPVPPSAAAAVFEVQAEGHTGLVQALVEAASVRVELPALEEGGM